MPLRLEKNGGTRQRGMRRRASSMLSRVRQQLNIYMGESTAWAHRQSRASKACAVQVTTANTQRGQEPVLESVLRVTEQVPLASPLRGERAWAKWKTAFGKRRSLQQGQLW